MIFDTHSHYDDEAFDHDREELLEILPSKGIGAVVTVGADIATSRAALALARSQREKAGKDCDSCERERLKIYAAIGVHPSDTEGLTDRDMDWLYEHAGEEDVVAIGEIGLDYHWKEPSPEVQKIWFRRQIALAGEVGLPVIYHSREAAAETMAIIQEMKAWEFGGVIHCYSYSKELAAEYVSMGFYIGVGGVVTFKNGRKLKETVEAVPLESIVLETDCPYLSPEPNRGRRNDSSNLVYVAEEIARIKGVSCEEVIQMTWENAERLYGKRRKCNAQVE